MVLLDSDYYYYYYYKAHCIQLRVFICKRIILSTSIKNRKHTYKNVLPLNLNSYE